MRIFLSGPAASGKTSVARRLGRKTDLPVFELSEKVGKSAFRAADRSPDHEQLLRLIEKHAKGVFDLSSETVAYVETRRLILDSGILVTLSGSVDELLERAKARLPPLEGGGESLGGISGDNILRHASSYEECHAEVDTTRASLDSVAEEVLEVARLEPVLIPLAERSCRIEIGSGVRSRMHKHLRYYLKGRSPVVIVTDTTVEKNWGGEVRQIVANDGHDVIFISIPEGEAAKQLRTVEKIWDDALSGGVDRSSMLIAVGGGVVGDLAGFAAATLLRGIAFAQVPTTLLAMVDSSIGGKTGFDTRQGKNLIGAFHQPRFVLSDVDVLATLPVEERRAGLAEVVKSAWLEGETAANRLERDAAALVEGRDEETVAAIRMAAGLKARLVTRDEREGGARMLLNLGHTIGHAIEASMGYRGVRHGEAVALGMVAAFRLAVALGLSSPEQAERMICLLRTLGLPVDLDDNLSDRVFSFVGSDKKRRSDRVNFVVPSAPGRVDIVPLSLSDLPALLAKRP